MTPSPNTNPRTGKLAGIIGGILAAISGGLFVFGAVAYYYDLQRLKKTSPLSAGLQLTFGAVPIAMTIVLGLVVLILGGFAIADALRERRGGAAGRLFLLFGLGALLGLYAAFSTGDPVPLGPAAIAAVITTLNYQAWRHRRRGP